MSKCINANEIIQILFDCIEEFDDGKEKCFVLSRGKQLSANEICVIIDFVDKLDGKEE